MSDWEQNKKDPEPGRGHRAVPPFAKQVKNGEEL